MITWIKLALTVLSLVKTFLRNAERQRAFDEGEKAQIVKALSQLTKQAGVTNQVRTEISKMSDADLDKELQGDDS